jgi:hypothetical protein
VKTLRVGDVGAAYKVGAETFMSREPTNGGKAKKSETPFSSSRNSDYAEKNCHRARLPLSSFLLVEGKKADEKQLHIEKTDLIFP